MDIFSLESIFTLAMLTLLQAVLGFDNLLYISLESQRVKRSHQALLRRLGIGLAVLLRIVLLFVIVNVIKLFQEPLITISWSQLLEVSFNMHSLIVLFGGIFILYTATKEILHMMSLEDIEAKGEGSSSFLRTLILIIIVNTVFSFDSILSAMALTDQFILMALSIIISGLLMIWLSDRVSDFLNKNRMYEVVGLFILFIVGILLVSEGGYLAHLHLFGYAVVPMNKATFYFVITIVVLVDLVQSRYSSRLIKQKKLRAKSTLST